GAAATQDVRVLASRIALTRNSSRRPMVSGHAPTSVCGMLAIGVGGLEVAMAMAGEPLHVTMPEIWGVRLTGELPPWLSAKDVILEMLRRHRCERRCATRPRRGELPQARHFADVWPRCPARGTR